MEKEKKVGIKALRVLDPPEQELLQHVYHQLEHHVNKYSKEIVWLNLYYNQTTTFEHDRQSELEVWIKEVIGEVFSTSNLILNSYGFVFNPIGNENNQRWHYDYSPTASTLFVTLTRTTEKNGTQFLVEPLEKTFPNEVGIFLQNVEEFIESEGVDAITVAQVVCKPFSLLKVLPGTVHRGIGNRDNFERVVFWITVDDHLHQVDEGYVVESSYYK